MNEKIIRVFPRRTKWTPSDALAFVGDPSLFRPEDFPVKVSVTFTWDIPEAERLYKAWKVYYSDVEMGGPALGDRGGKFSPGLFVEPGRVVTSRGCIRSCAHCFVPEREGTIRELEIKDGWDVFDNNLLACSREHVEKVFNMLSKQKKGAVLSGGLDVRLFNSWHVELLRKIRISDIFFAYDQPGIEEELKRVVDLISWIPEWKRRCYVLIGYPGDSLSAAEERLRWTYKNGLLPFPMVYRDKSERQVIGRPWVELRGWWVRPSNYRRKKT